jgi:cytochrome c oxidase assembly factor CtaG
MVPHWVSLALAAVGVLVLAYFFIAQLVRRNSNGSSPTLITVLGVCLGVALVAFAAMLILVLV